MKALVLLPFLIVAVSAEPAAPAKPEKPAVAEKVIAKMAKLETKERYTFVEVQVLEKVPDGICIRHKEGTPPKGVGSILHHGGITFIPYESLPDAVRRQMGGFTAQEARKYRDKMAEDDKVGKRHPLTEGPEFISYNPEGDKEFTRDSK